MSGRDGEIPMLGTSVLFSQEEGLIVYPSGLLVDMSMLCCSTSCEGNHSKRWEAVITITVFFQSSWPWDGGIITILLGIPQDT